MSTHNSNTASPQPVTRDWPVAEFCRISRRLRGLSVERSFVNIHKSACSPTAMSRLNLPNMFWCCSQPALVLHWNLLQSLITLRSSEEMHWIYQSIVSDVNNANNMQYNSKYYSKWFAVGRAHSPAGKYLYLNPAHADICTFLYAVCINRCKFQSLQRTMQLFDIQYYKMKDLTKATFMELWNI